MTDSQRTPPTTVFRVVLLLSGWAVAIVLGIRLWQPDPPPAPVPIATPRPESAMERTFREWAAQAEFDGALIGFCLLDEKGETVFASPLAKDALCPASSLKTVTTGAAFGLLGPEFRFETTLVATAPLKEGALEGDLVLVGGGDPTFSPDDVEKMAEAAIAAGLKKVSGKLRVDASVFPHDPLSDHWNWGDIGNGYGAGAFGLNLNHNRLKLRFEPATEEGKPAKFVGGAPARREMRWENHVLTGPPGSGDGVVVYSEPYGRTITMRGTVPAGEESFTVSGAIPDPPALVAELLQAKLESGGVTFADGAGPFAESTKTTLATHQSKPLAEIIDHLHRVSDNLEAQCVFLTIGLKQKADPAEAIREYWEKAGVSFVGLRLIDGSGLARANMIRPVDLARVNLAARQGPNGERFFKSLSTYAEGSVRGKVGGMSGVLTQVGFIRTEKGRDLTFAIMANGLSRGADFWTRLDELLDTVRTLDL